MDVSSLTETELFRKSTDGENEKPAHSLQVLRVSSQRGKNTTSI